MYKKAKQINSCLCGCATTRKGNSGELYCTECFNIVDYDMVTVTTEEKAVSIVICKNGAYTRDVRNIKGASELIIAINDIVSHGGEIVAIEELDTDVLGYLTKVLTDDDIDAMAADIPE